MTSTICLIRHGETEWNRLGKIQGRTDIPLNENGRKQAIDTSTYLTKREYDLLLTSPLRRAKETAEIINRTLRLPIQTVDEFIERNYGEAEGLTREEIAKNFANTPIPNIESIEDLHGRIITGLDNIIQIHPNKKIILIAHGAVINALLALLTDSKIGSGKTKLVNACISNIEFEDDRWLVKDYNQATHLLK